MYDIYTKCSASSIMHQDVDNNNYTLVLIFDDVLEKKKSHLYVHCKLKYHKFSCNHTLERQCAVEVLSISYKKISPVAISVVISVNERQTP